MEPDQTEPKAETDYYDLRNWSWGDKLRPPRSVLLEVRLALPALAPVILIHNSVLTNGLHYISGVVESRCTLTVCVTVSISTPAHSQINPLQSVTLLIIPLKLSIIFSVLGRRAGIQIISGTTRGSLLKRAPTVNLAATILQFEDQFRKVIIISFCFRFSLVWLL